MTATWMRPVEGAGTWTHTQPHGLRLTLLGTFVVCLLLTLAFLAVLAVGRQVMCATHVHDGHPTLSYCPGFVPEATR